MAHTKLTFWFATATVALLGAACGADFADSGGLGGGYNTSDAGTSGGCFSSNECPTGWTCSEFGTCVPPPSPVEQPDGGTGPGAPPPEVEREFGQPTSTLRYVYV